MLAYICHSSPGRIEAENSEAQGHLLLFHYLGNLRLAWSTLTVFMKIKKTPTKEKRFGWYSNGSERFYPTFKNSRQTGSTNCVLWSSDHWVETSAWAQASPETTEAKMVWLQANSEKTKPKLVWVQANPGTTGTKLGNAQGLLQSCPIESAANNLQQPGKLKQ